MPDTAKRGRSRRPIAALFRRTAQPAVAVCARFGISPNTVSAASILAAAGAGAALAGVDIGRVMVGAGTDEVVVGVSPWHGLIALAVPLVLLRLWLNMLDGMVALATDRCSPVGELWNELPDRLSDVLIFLGAAHSGLCAPVFGYLAAVAALLVAYVGTLGQAVGAGRRFEGWMSKPWRMVALVLGLLAELWAPNAFLIVPGTSDPSVIRPLELAFSLIVIGSLDTIRRRMRHIVRALPINPPS